MYLDPGIGSIILQGILAGILGIGVFFRLGWHRLKSLFGMTDQSLEEENAFPNNDDEQPIE